MGFRVQGPQVLLMMDLRWTNPSLSNDLHIIWVLTGRGLRSRRPNKRELRACGFKPRLQCMRRCKVQLSEDTLPQANMEVQEGTTVRCQGDHLSSSIL